MKRPNELQTDGRDDLSKRSFMWYRTEDLINCLPPNRPIYKDSGLWQIRTDDMNNVLMQQKTNRPCFG